MAVHVDDQVAAYALGALEQDARGPIERHLAECPTCAADAAQARHVAALLPYTVTPYKAPPELRAAVLDQLPRRSDADRAGDGAAHQPRWRAALLLGLPWTAAAAGWAVVLGLLSYSHGQTDRIASLQQDEQRRLIALTTETQRMQTVQSYLFTPGIMARQLVYQAGRAPHTTVMLFYAPGYLHALVTARGLAVLPAPKTYRIWARTSTGARVPLGRLITSGPRAEGSTLISAPGPLDQYAVIGVSLEQQTAALPAHPILIFKASLPPQR